MDRNRTDYNTYPMDFTNIGEEQTVSGEHNFRNRSQYSPGLFSPSQEFQGVPDSIPRTPGDTGRSLEPHCRRFRQLTHGWFQR